jgi:polyhydroxyalkanoate synthesis regulator phasin
VTAVKSDVADLKSDMTVVKSDVADLKSDMTAVKSNIADVKSDIGVLLSSSPVVNERVDNLDARVGALEARSDP